ncbi:hypothetical protein AXA70_21080 [Xanthomonas arboricola pv. juglandis]|nr:hypothetical protein AXA70_21080 [Xanthomonas arboricola pv. juglandis]
MERAGHSADCFFTGTDTFTYVVSDGKANSNTATVTVTVLGPNLPPLAFDDVVDLKENGSVRIDPTANDWDINGDDLQAVLVCGPSHGRLSLNPDGTYTYTPDANWYGLDGFTYQAFDGQYRSNPAMVWIRVAPVNQAPVAAADAFTVRAGVATRLDVLANDSDVDGDGLTAKLATSPKNGTLIRNRDGSFSYTAKSGFVGTDTFTYVATDGALDSRPVTVSITVLAPNRAPVARDDKATTMAGAAVRINVLGNDSDADGDRLAALLVCAPSHGKLSLNADGSYTYTPDKGWYGTDSFSYRATDGDAQSGVAMVSITVQKVNRAPTAQSASFQVQKDGSVRIDFDCLVNDPDGDALTLSLTNPSKGSLTRNRDGSYTYRPKSGFVGTDTFTYSVSDGKLTASASITLVVSKNPPRDNAMSIVVGASASAASVQGGGYIVVNLGASSQPVIDWTATAGTPREHWMGRATGRRGVRDRSAGCADRSCGTARLSDGRRPRRAAAIEIHIGGKDVSRTGERHMQARRLMLIATLTMGLLVNHPSIAQSQIPSETPHTGMSPKTLERAYIESYEQSGFRLVSRHRELDPSGTWTIKLAFRLKSAQKGPDAPSTTLRLRGGLPSTCACYLVRESFRGANANSPDPAAIALGERALIKADRAALEKVQQRLGVSIPYAG